MKVIKKFRVLTITEDKINDDTVLKLIEPNHHYTSLWQTFDTEEEALEAAHKFNKYMEFVIVSVYSFGND